ncbi:Probable E3 ubiquitin-protein ligase HIP1 [Linum perenne]
MPVFPESSSASNSTADGKKKKKSTAFSGFGCTAEASRKVSVPAAIRSSADWEWKKVKVKKRNQTAAIAAASTAARPKEIGTSEQVHIVDSVNSVATGRNVSARGKTDVENFDSMEREMEMERSCLPRGTAVDPEVVYPAGIVTLRPEPELLRSRYCRHFRLTARDGLAEVLKLGNGFMMEERQDRYHDDWRLDIDDMSYEQLLALTDSIGYVSTGLKEHEISKCISKFKLSFFGNLSSQIHTTLGKKCSICQEEFEGDQDLGKLECGHGFHIQCIKQWLANKNNCPVCKTEPLARS